MRVLLSTLNAKFIHTNLAIRILYEQNQDRESLQWKEFTIKEDPNEIAGYCAAFNVIAFSCYIWNISQTLKVCQQVKILNPDCKILLGGPEVSYDYEDVISRKEVDFIISGEGEIPFKLFLEQYPDVENVPGLIFKNEKVINTNAPAPQFDVKHFEQSMPYRFDEPGSLANKVLYIETSRGCPYKCEFCLASLDNKVRYLPDTHIKNTLLFLMQNGRVIKFLDRTFNIKRDFTIDIFKFILKNRRPGNIFQFEITADILHPDIIKFIHEEVPTGLFRFEIGIQTVNQQANLQVSRKQSFEKTRKIIKELDYKIEMHLDLIVGLPLDRWEDIKYSIEEVFKLYAPEMQLGFLKFLKGTTMRHKPEHGYVFDPEPPYQIVESKYLSKEELKKITLLENALEIYWNGKKACHSLKYVAHHYSIFDFLLGLGQLFEKQRTSLHYSLDYTFEILHQYALTHFPDDNILAELIAIDYYLHFKVRPQLKFLQECSAEKKQAAVNQLEKTQEKYRYIALDLSFDFDSLITGNTQVKSTAPLLIRYNGTSKAQIIKTTQRAEKLIVLE